MDKQQAISDAAKAVAAYRKQPDHNVAAWHEMQQKVQAALDCGATFEDIAPAA